MKLNKDQTKAFDALGRWLWDAGRQEFRLGGYAGTGKTTLLREFVNRLDTPPFCCAPTGKAASVLNQKIGSEHLQVTTIHKLLYMPNENTRRAKLEADIVALKQELQQHPENATALKELTTLEFKIKQLGLEFNIKDHPVTPGSLVIVDEASMVTGRIYQDLRDTGAKLLLVGDPGQLPPVNGSDAFDAAPPDAVLEQIMRQEAGNDIIRLASDIRLNRALGKYSEECCWITPTDNIQPDVWLTADQVITGKNETRRRINRWMRTQFGYSRSPYPVRGDKLICLKNQYQNDKLLYVNGVQARAVEDGFVSEGVGGLYCSIDYEDTVRQCVPMAQEPFAVHYDRFFTEDTDFKDAYRFDYAYAITVHKSQGSEWDTVIIADDTFGADKVDFRRRWLYTAITRASKRLIWAQK